MKKFLPVLLVALSAGLFFSACSSTESEEPVKTMLETIGITSDLSNFQTLVDRAGLNDTLNSRPSLTMFAPTNAAWDTYRASSGYFSLADIPIPQLKQILLYHLSNSVLKPENVPQAYLPALASFGGTPYALKFFVRTIGNTWTLTCGAPTYRP